LQWLAAFFDLCLFVSIGADLDWLWTQIGHKQDISLLEESIVAWQRDHLNLEC